MAQRGLHLSVQYIWILNEILCFIVFQRCAVTLALNCNGNFCPPDQVCRFDLHTDGRLDIGCVHPSSHHSPHGHSHEAQCTTALSPHNPCYCATDECINIVFHGTTRPFRCGPYNCIHYCIISEDTYGHLILGCGTSPNNIAHCLPNLPTKGSKCFCDSKACVDQTLSSLFSGHQVTGLVCSGGSHVHACHSGQVCHINHETNGHFHKYCDVAGLTPQCGAVPLPGQHCYCTTQQCVYGYFPVNGGFSNWSFWGSCSKTCGGGYQYRSRSCNNPAPQNGGAPCFGPVAESQNCITQHCPVNGGFSNWSSWGSCTKTCGGGSQSRSRSCNHPAPRYGGAPCSGPSSESQGCNTHHCPINGGFSNWSSWGSCTKTCGGGSQSRSRLCNNPAPRYGGTSCSGPSTESQGCNTHHCPVNGGFSNWSSWRSCSKTCGGGYQYRSRSCNHPAPQNGGTPCYGPYTEYRTCNTHHCPVDGGYSSWTSWGPCSVTCGGGSQSRSRLCDHPSPQYGGASCSGLSTESQGCNTRHCPIPTTTSSVNCDCIDSKLVHCEDAHVCSNDLLKKNCPVACGICVPPTDSTFVHCEDAHICSNDLLKTLCPVSCGLCVKNPSGPVLP